MTTNFTANYIASKTNAMQPTQVERFRSIANQALYAAQYLSEVQGDSTKLSAIKAYYLATPSGIQPAVRDIYDYVDAGSGNGGAISTDAAAYQAFTDCLTVYRQNTALVNAFINRK